MHAVMNEIDSRVVGAPVVDITEFDAGIHFARFERDDVLPLQPRIAFCKLPAEDLSSVHALEEDGFQFAELQLSIRLRLTQRFSVPPSPYVFGRAQTTSDVQAALDLARTIFTHDRYSTDEHLGRRVSGLRYEAYLKRSLSDPDESVYVMKNQMTGEVVSFSSLRRTDAASARLLIGGVAERYKDSGLGVLHDRIGLNLYHAEGIRVVDSAVSAANYPIVNLEIGALGFKVRRAFVVLRKRYESK